MAAQSTREKIFEAVASRFETLINGAGIYNLDLTSPGRVNRWRHLAGVPFDPETESTPIINVQDTINRTQQRVSNVHEHELTFLVVGFVQHDTNPAAEARKLISDLINAVGSDRSWGSLALDTDPLNDEISTYQENKNYAAVKLEFMVKYRTPSFNPNPA